MKALFQSIILISILFILSCTQNDPQLPANGNYSLDSYGQWTGVTGQNNSGTSAASGDTYADFEENPFVSVSDQKVSTFSIDADGASYANVRRFIQQDNQLPPIGTVRTEEMINYFNLDYPHDNVNHPISLNGEVSSCPWNDDNKLVRIGIKGKDISPSQLPPSNYVFLIDVSGSMKSPDKLALLKEGFVQFVNELDAEDRVAIVTYAGESGVALSSTSGDRKSEIVDAIEKLGAGGSTAGAEGILTAYEIAQYAFIENGNNRVILGTDGDFNVGISDKEELIKLIEEKRESNIFLTVLGVGRGNLRDASLEQIANHGNGTYEYLDKVEELRKVFIHENHKFFTVAKDVKVQVEFNEFLVEKYRLIGYENRLLNEEDFEDDTKDAGEIGANQSITALYEIIPQSNALNLGQPTFTIDFRYKHPDEDHSIPLQLSIKDRNNSFQNATDYMQFTASIASYSMLITDSEYKGSSTYDKVLDWLKLNQLKDPHGYLKEFRNLVETSKSY